MTTEDRIRQVVSENGGLTVAIDRISDTDDLFAAGMSSHASVNVMLGLENEFEVEFPDELLKRATFESIANIATAMSGLRSLPT